MSYRAATCNAYAPGSADANAATIKRAAAETDVLLVQEADSQVVAAIVKLVGFVAYLASGVGARNPIAWREDQFELITAGWSRIMKNKPGIKDGPDRSMVWVVLREIATGRKVIHINAHLIHQAFTSHRERRPSWYASLAVLGAKALILIVRHRCPAVINADWNNPYKFDIPKIDEREVASPPTHGRTRRYDRFFLVGLVTAVLVRVLKLSTTDHGILIVKVTLGAGSPSVSTPKPSPAEEDTMLTAADIKNLWRHKEKMDDAPTGRFMSSAIANLHNGMQRHDKQLEEIQRQLAEIAAAAAVKAKD